MLLYLVRRYLVRIDQSQGCVWHLDRKRIANYSPLLKVTGSLHADTRAVYLIKRYFIVFLSPKIKPCDPTWTWKTVLK